MPPQTKTTKPKDPKPRREPLPLDPEDVFDAAAAAAEVLAAGAEPEPKAKTNKLALVARILRLLAALLAGGLGAELAHRLVQ